jgi:hypothetical protein
VRIPHEGDERVTCSSCRFRYVKTRGFCPVCGAAPETDETAALVCSDGRNSVARGQGSAGPRRIRKTFGAVLRNPIPVFAPMLLIGAFLWFAQSNRLPHASALAPTPAILNPPEITPASAPETAPGAATDPLNSGPINGRINKDSGSAAPSAAIPPETGDDPASLWKRVGTGSASAEVELARLYLDGTHVPQNCEQAHLLLLAALKKQSSKAGDLLTGVYSQRCP